ncbi:homeobox-domain-containing protein [Rozella allomycis CSF55]|uniref:Homeobox-domain-containing protein n=1 Tax=Rozella allomycis (strain CSF55) TaxID=988480 RepID=A0A075B050_ROZAC|nr:Homeobox domain-containing protein [Rozella allomycis CSF55]RKP22121.1 homeobox-domain-containing protein [Rozella allomycis CSF55]|eukprot:EPZ35963.1 Homeobox domain-containing protein [Rozella allomycis CSF55]
MPNDKECGIFEEFLQHNKIDVRSDETIVEQRVDQSKSGEKARKFHEYRHEEPVKRRNRLSLHQKDELDKSFTSCPHPSKREMERLVQTTNLSSKTIRIWFQNQRAKSKRIKEKAMEEAEEDRKTPTTRKLTENQRKQLEVLFLLDPSGGNVQNEDIQQIADFIGSDISLVKNWIEIHRYQNKQQQ